MSIRCNPNLENPNLTCLCTILPDSEGSPNSGMGRVCPEVSQGFGHGLGFAGGRVANGAARPRLALGGWSSDLAAVLGMV